MFLFRSLLTSIVMICPGIAPMLGAQERNSPKYISPLAAKSLLTKNELDTLPFGPQMVAEMRLKGQKEIKKWRIGEQPWKLVEGLRLGVWMSKKEYRIGEPLHVLFVVKNEARGRGLDMWLTVTGHTSTIWNSSGIHLVREKKLGVGVEDRRLAAHIWACGGNSLAAINSKSYMCIRGDLRGKGLSPGVYRVWWHYGDLCSNEVSFTILPEKSRTPTEVDTAGGNDHFSWIRLGYERAKAPIVIDGTLQRRIKSVRRERQYFLGLAATLAMGNDDRWYPDIFDLPTNDEYLSASAKFGKSNHGGSSVPKSVTINLDRLMQSKQVNLANLKLHLAVIILPKRGATFPKRGGGEKFADPGEEKSIAGLLLDSPVKALKLNVDLPEDWLHSLPFHGPAKCAFVISREPLRNRMGLTRAMRKANSREEPPEWKGLVRTPWLEINVPAP